MLHDNGIKVVRKIFEQHHYVMSTAEILKAKLYYADIKQLLDEGYIERIHNVTLYLDRYNIVIQKFLHSRLPNRRRLNLF